MRTAGAGLVRPPRGKYYEAMDSGLLLNILSSWQVIVACIVIMFLLPIIFFLAAGRRARKRPVRRAAGTKR